jgi:hypothetical protein
LGAVVAVGSGVFAGVGIVVAVGARVVVGEEMTEPQPVATKGRLSKRTTRMECVRHLDMGLFPFLSSVL